MADNDFKLFREVANEVMDMKISDFLNLCVERGVNATLVTSAISVCLYEIACKVMFDENK